MELLWRILGQVISEETTVSHHSQGFQRNARLVLSIRRKEIFESLEAASWTSILSNGPTSSELESWHTLRIPLGQIYLWFCSIRLLSLLLYWSVFHCWETPGRLAAWPFFFSFFIKCMQPNWLWHCFEFTKSENSTKCPCSTYKSRRFDCFCSSFFFRCSLTVNSAFVPYSWFSKIKDSLRWEDYSFGDFFKAIEDYGEKSPSMASINRKISIVYEGREIRNDSVYSYRPKMKSQDWNGLV